MKLWRKIEQIVDKINTEPEAGRNFLTGVLMLGGIGVFFCLVWFGLMVAAGMPLWALIFDSAIILFCVWAIVKGVIPMSKEAFKQIDEKEKKQKEHE